MRKVLILTAAYGEGHNAAARGLQAALTAGGRMEPVLLDPFADIYGAFYDRSRRQYLQMIERFPRVWAALYTLLHRTPLIHPLAASQPALRRRLRQALAETQPAAVVSVYPLFPYLLNALAPPGAVRSFRLYTVVTDSITINSVWHRAPSDIFLLPNEESAAVMRAAGVAADRVRVSGFPVPPRFAEQREPRPNPEAGGGRVLYMINAERQQAPAIVRRILQVPALKLTVTAGRDDALKARIEAVMREAGGEGTVHGWTNEMPELLMSHHVLIGKAGGATVQEAIAARTPMLITKVVPGQEEGNAQLLLKHGCAAVRETPDALANELGALFADGAHQWHQWQSRMAAISRPAAAAEMAEMIAGECAAEGKAAAVL